MNEEPAAKIWYPSLFGKVYMFLSNLSHYCTLTLASPFTHSTSLLPRLMSLLAYKESDSTRQDARETAKDATFLQASLSLP